MGLKYFGTNLDEHGHYFWNFEDGVMSKDWKTTMEKIPFNPYYFAKFPKGHKSFFHIAGFTVLALSGSIKDQRSGTVSVFFMEGIHSLSDLHSEIMKNLTAKKILAGVEKLAD